jgi:hypothetical protein
MANTNTIFSETYIQGTFIAVDNHGQAMTQPQTLEVVSGYLVKLSKAMIIVSVSIAIANSVVSIEVKGYLKGYINSEVAKDSTISRTIVEAFVTEIGDKVANEQTEEYPILYFTIRNKSPPLSFNYLYI